MTFHLIFLLIAVIAVTFYLRYYERTKDNLSLFCLGCWSFTLGLQLGWLLGKLLGL